MAKSNITAFVSKPTGIYTLVSFPLKIYIQLNYLFFTTNMQSLYIGPTVHIVPWGIKVSVKSKQMPKLFMAAGV